METLVLFQAGNRQFGLDMPVVRSIHRASAILTDRSGADDNSILILDGEEIPIYDLSSILGQTTSSRDNRTGKIILADAQGHPLALMVERVDGIVTAEKDQIESLPPIFHDSALTCFPSVLRHDDKLILILNPRGLGRIGASKKEEQ